MCQSDNGSITETHALRQWSKNYIRSIEGIKNPRAPMQMQAMLQTAGFIDLEMTTIQLPLCGWSTGKDSVLSLVIQFLLIQKQVAGMVS